MSKQDGIIRLVGSTDGLTFYKANGKYLVRKSSGPNKEQIKTGENYQRTRENNSEFGACSKISKSFRTSLAPLKPLTDGQFGNRVTKLFKFLIDNDEGVRGQRPVRLSSHRKDFAKFECNIKYKLSKAISGTFTMDHNAERTLATVTIHEGQTNALQGPEGATHFRMIHALSVVSDFIYDEKTRSYIPAEPDLDTKRDIQYSPYFSLEEINSSAYSSTVSLSIPTPLPDTVSVLHAFGLSFSQQLGSIDYPLKEGHSLSILEIF